MLSLGFMQRQRSIILLRIALKLIKTGNEVLVNHTGCDG